MFFSFGEDGRTLTLSGVVKRESASPESTTTAAEDAQSTSVPAIPSRTSWISEREGNFNFNRTVRLPVPVDTQAVKAS